MLGRLLLSLACVICASRLFIAPTFSTPAPYPESSSYVEGCTPYIGSRNPCNIITLVLHRIIRCGLSARDGTATSLAIFHLYRFCSRLFRASAA
ncbi:hypothetical protein EV401DRAFT_765219 [Pisolithus croceorrhizus]|nr:hypothetical protein EV401DRAFT_765219 [Pisolithus croceorrhizus]